MRLFSSELQAFSEGVQIIYIQYGRINDNN